MKYCKLFVDNQVLLLFLFILNLVCNGVWLSQQFGILSVVLVVVLSAICAVVETFVSRFLKPLPLKATFVSLVVFIHNLIGLVDYYLLYQFGTVIDMSILDTILVTNTHEAKEFVSAYFSPMVIVLLIGACEGCGCCPSVNTIRDKTAVRLHPFGIDISEIYQEIRHVIRFDMQV